MGGGGSGGPKWGTIDTMLLMLMMLSLGLRLNLWLPLFFACSTTHVHGRACPQRLQGGAIKVEYVCRLVLPGVGVGFQEYISCVVCCMPLQKRAVGR